MIRSFPPVYVTEALGANEMDVQWNENTLYLSFSKCQVSKANQFYRRSAVQQRGVSNSLVHFVLSK